jgi:DNA adenine methylase
MALNGGKFYLASKIVALMPPHIHYVEPYFGGGAVLLARNPEGVSEVVNDIHGDLYNFWGVLRDEELFPRLLRRLQATPFDDTLFEECREMLVEPPLTMMIGRDIERAWAFFVLCRQSLAGRMKSFTGITRTRTRRGMNNEVSAWLTAIEGLPQVHERLKRVLILNRDALEVIESQDGENTLFYLDPPYLKETRTAPEVYEHEMTYEQHKALLKLLGSLKGKFLLSGYPSDLYERYANKYDWRRKDFTLPNNAAGGEKKRKMTECLWSNYDLPTGDE